MLAQKIAIVGSTNTDMVVIADRIPVPGETVLASHFFMNPGDKGAHQEMAIARGWGYAKFITKLPSGVALITVDRSRENSIVVNQGGNDALLPDDFTDELLLELEQCKMVLMQFEIPTQTVLFVARYAVSKGLKVIINPAPVQEIPDACSLI